MVRLEEVEINNFKNVEKGIIKLKEITPEDNFALNGETIGIYGQNGSGKSSLIEALALVRKIVLNEKIPENSHEYILKGKNSLSINLVFYMKLEDKHFKIKYEITLKKVHEDGDIRIEISREKLIYKNYNFEESKWDSYYQLYLAGDGIEIGPKYLIDKLVDDNNQLLHLIVDKKVSYREGKSVVFSNQFLKKIEEKIGKETRFKLIMKLKKYFAVDFSVISNTELGLISGNIMMPITFRCGSYHGILGVSLNSSSTLPLEGFELLENVLSQMNIVLESIVPEMKLSIKKMGKELDENSEEVISFQLQSIKGDEEIPIKYESEGIKKIISIIGMLILAFNNPSFTFIVDELDAGIYEYLLGEILSVFSNYAQGQLIFTSHNLRPLEVLKPSSIRFTTTNSKNKYIKAANIKPNNNLRNVYMRSILLNDSKEPLQKETKTYKIRKAFRRAGRDIIEQ